MKISFAKSLPRLLVGALLVALLFSTGCGKSDSAKEASPGLEPVTSIRITGNDRMRFDPVEFAVNAGETITVTFHNIGMMSKETMGHNWVLLASGVAPQTFAAASIGHPRTHYIAPEYADRVIAGTAVLGPGEEETVTFVAPSTPGNYPYVCSFPGHTPARMVGVMVVR